MFNCIHVYTIFTLYEAQALDCAGCTHNIYICMYVCMRLCVFVFVCVYRVIDCEDKNKMGRLNLVSLFAPTLMTVNADAVSQTPSSLPP